MALLEDKVVLVNGGSQGVGAGIVRAALREGATVAFTGRRAEVGERLAARTGATFVRADLADPERVRGSVDEVIAAHGRVDSLVNAAGLTSRGSLLDTEAVLLVDDDQAELLESNVLLQQGVGADDKVQVAASQLLARLPLLARRHGTDEQPDAVGGAGEALASVEVVLHGEDFRRRHQRHLGGVFHGDDRRPEGDDGLA